MAVVVRRARESFSMREMPEISFRLIGPGDVQNMVRWLREPEVARWYWDSTRLTEEELTEKWRKRTAEPEPGADRYIIVADGSDVGEIQVSDIGSDTACAKQVGISNAAGVDLLIGEPEWRDRGVGTSVLQAFTREFAFTRPGITTCIIDPEPENLRAIRCYEKVGFRYVRTYHSEEEGVDVYLMRMDGPPEQRTAFPRLRRHLPSCN